MDKGTDSIGLLDLPVDSLINIFECLSFEEIAKSRIICKRIDDICQKILNRGFKRAANESAIAYKRIKMLLPRRESERRNHALVRHADILSSVETRLSMLSMTYTKYIDLNMCCFIPGRVLDEIFHILRLTKQRCVSLRPLEILQEFRDISSMAIEHFEEHIASEFKRRLERNTLLRVHSAGADNMPASESECGASELFWVRNLARTGLIAPLPSISLPDIAQSGSSHNDTTGGLRVHRSLYHGAPSKDFVIKKLQKTIAVLERKQLKQAHQNKYYKREINRLNRNFGLAKRRLDEMDSKYKELIETVRQYNMPAASKMNTTASTDDGLNQANISNNTETGENLLKNEDKMLRPLEAAALDNDEDVIIDTAASSRSSAEKTTPSNKRTWKSDEQQTPEIVNKKTRSECLLID